MSTLPDQNLAPYQFDKSELWESIHGELDQFIVSATAEALDPHTLGEQRIHAAGQARGLTDFREHLLWLREEAQKRRG